jgi:sigma-B regulation protein RsbU (phosphoserine phosphatase)
MAFLTANNGPSEGKRIELDGQLGEYMLGRHPDCHVVVDVGAVSRYHAKITVDDKKQFYIEDNKSRNGTYLNGVNLQQRTLLQEGDQIRVCDVDFTFHFETVPRQVEPARTVELDSSSGSSLGAILVDDMKDSGSTIMSKLDVSSATGRLQFTASPQVKLEALMEITKNLSRAISLDAVLPGVLDSLFRIFMQADRGFIVLRDAKGTLVPFWTKVRRENASDQHRLSRTIVDQVMETKEAILSADAASDERFEMSQSIADFRIRSMMCAPLLDSEKNAMGVLQVDTLDQRKRFQQEDLEVLANVATQSGIAIDNARMHEEALQRRAIDRDLEVAHEVQQGFLPRRSPQIEGYSFYDYYEPANTVGGDFFDYIELRDGRVVVLVADVVGHGIAAALMMAKVSAESKFSLANEPVVNEAVTQLNDVICGLNLDRFVTMIMVVIDPKTHEVTIVNAGHMAPIWKKSTGEVAEPGSDLKGLPIGINAGHKYEKRTIKLEPGDSLTLYTDGINECSDGDGMYGIERLHELVKSGDSDPAQLGDKIVTDVRSFMDGEPQEDDMCIVCLARTS